MPLYDEPLFSQTTQNPAPESSLIQAPSSGIGIAPEQAPAPVVELGRSAILPRPTLRDQARQDIESLPTLQRVGLALRAFGAGVAGQPSPVEAFVRQKREERALQATELRAHVDALEAGSKIAKTLTGEAKSSFVKDYQKQLNEMRPGLGDTFGHVAEQPDLLSQFQSYAPSLPEPVKLMMRQNPDAFWKFASSAEGVKLLEHARDQHNLGISTRKATGMIAHLQQLGLPPELVTEATRGKQLTIATFNKLQEALPNGHPYKLSEEQKKSISASDSNSNMFYRSLGLLSPADEAEVRRKLAEKTPKLQPGEIIDLPLGGKNFAKAAYDPDKSLFPQAEHNADGFAILGKGTKEGTTINMPSSTGFGVNPATGKPAHYTIGKDGTVRWDPIAPVPKGGVLGAIVDEALKNPKAAPKAIAKPPAKPPAGKPTPTAADRAYVVAHPETRQRFIDNFGVAP